MAHRFSTLTVADATSSAAATPEQVRMVSNVISLPLQGDVIARAEAASTPANCHAWVMRVVDVLLTTPTRRPFAIQAEISLEATQGHALARIMVDGQTTSRQIRTNCKPHFFDTSLRLAIRRSTYLRDRLRLLVWVEASGTVLGGEAQAVVDAIDIHAR